MSTAYTYQFYDKTLRDFKEMFILTYLVLLQEMLFSLVTWGLLFVVLQSGREKAKEFMMDMALELKPVVTYLPSNVVSFKSCLS